MRTIILFAIATVVATLAPAQIYVKAGAAGQNNGTSWTDAKTDLQEAIHAASAGDTIWVGEGTYLPSIDTLGQLPLMNESRTFWLKNGVVLLGGFLGTETALSQRDPVNNKAILEGDLGAGVFAEHVLSVYPGVDSSAVMDGFVVQHGKSTMLSQEKSGSGMYLRGHAEFRNVHFRNNETYHQGGALYAVSSYSKFIACTFSDNRTMLYDGAAGNFVYSHVKMYNCVYANNHAGRFGGAITTVESDLLVQNGTFVGNVGGVNVFQFSTSGNIALNNCIFTADNTGQGIIGISGATYAFRDCLAPMDNNWLILSATMRAGTPTFTNAAAGDYSLQAGSDGIDDTLSVTPENPHADLLGNPRSVGFSMDMGAYEFQGGVGVENALPAMSMRLFPNPAHNMLRVQTEAAVTKIQIHNLAGQLVMEGSGNAMVVEGLPAGLYLLTAQTEQGICSQRFLKD